MVSFTPHPLSLRGKSSPYSTDVGLCGRCAAISHYDINKYVGTDGLMQCGPKPVVVLPVRESDNVANRWFIVRVSEGVQ
jgi:hypothetical protein